MRQPLQPAFKCHPVITHRWQEWISNLFQISPFNIPLFQIPPNSSCFLSKPSLIAVFWQGLTACTHLLTLTSNLSPPRLPATTAGISMSGIGDKWAGGRRPFSLKCVSRPSLVALSVCAQLADSLPLCMWAAWRFVCWRHSAWDASHARVKVPGNLYYSITLNPCDYLRSLTADWSPNPLRQEFVGVVWFDCNISKQSQKKQNLSCEKRQTKDNCSILVRKMCVPARLHCS